MSSSATCSAGATPLSRLRRRRPCKRPDLAKSPQGEIVLEAKETYEKIEEAHQKHNKRAALIITILAALQLAIVMASAAIITEIVLLEIVSAGLGLFGLGLALIGWFAPMLIEL